ncbi:MAG: archaemetzincin family Zn-dependent metalloprotease [Deltaproteobacteria bacterium]|nr:archaemetzincin family Zn-dependent metalloprotease [Deltaproteobacteria bacterium]MBZ0220619.1 archaemetzincin family Zn-dependent metalloprotease [Deltaproteobacteria bacterium]
MLLILPVGEVDLDTLERLRQDLEREFGFEAAVAGEKDAFLTPDFALDEERGQYNSTSILFYIMERPELKRYGRVLGVASVDFFAPGLNFVFGEAGPRAAVISTYRLRETFYGREEDRGLLRKRILTEAAHELGHTFGLGHCAFPDCVMFFSNTIEDTDRKGPRFKGRCLEKMVEAGAIGKGKGPG